MESSASVVQLHFLWFGKVSIREGACGNNGHGKQNRGGPHASCADARTPRFLALRGNILVQCATCNVLVVSQI